MGLAAFKLGDGRLAYGALTMSLEMKPERIDARLKLASLFLSARE